MATISPNPSSSSAPVAADSVLMPLTAAGVRCRDPVVVLAHLDRIAEAEVTPDFISSFGVRNLHLAVIEEDRAYDSNGQGHVGQMRG